MSRSMVSRRVIGASMFAFVLATHPRIDGAQQRPSRRYLFPPQELGLLESPDRDAWQRPDQIMDALGIADGSRVADLEASGGWFAVRLARRVGPNGRVYIAAFQPLMIEEIERRIAREGLGNAQTILGTPQNLGLPRGPLDAVLIVNTYRTLAAPVSVLRNVASVLGPRGRVGIVDFKQTGGGPGPPLQDRIDPSRIVRDAGAAGLRLITRESFLPYQYLLILGR